MNEPIQVIGITGVAGSGKDTVAGILAHRHGYFRVALGDAVRGAIRDMDGPTWSVTKELEKAGLTSRWACQKVGGDARERVADLVHDASGWGDGSPISGEAWHGVARAYAYIAAFKILYLATIHPVSRRRFVIPDISYPHEIAAFRDVMRELGGTYVTWRIDRDGAGLSGAEAAHASERGRATIPADATLRNDGTIDELAGRVADLLGSNLTPGTRPTH